MLTFLMKMVGQSLQPVTHSHVQGLSCGTRQVVESGEAKDGGQKPGGSGLGGAMLTSAGGRANCKCKIKSDW